MAANNQLTLIEKEVAKLQARLIWHRGSLDQFIENDLIKIYAAELAQFYFPKRADSPLYLSPVAHAFAVDLAIAPALHRLHHVWRYDYDSLDVLANFYCFSTPSKGYYHLAQGKLPPLRIEQVQEGCAWLGIELDNHIETLIETYCVEGARGRVAARVLETLAGLTHDREQNALYGFMEQEQQRRLRKFKGQGRFRFLRRGRYWMALGTAEQVTTLDIRKDPPTNLFGFRVTVEKEKVRIYVAKSAIEMLKADLIATLEKEASIVWRVQKVNTLYEDFHRRHRYANAFNWTNLDNWVERRVREAARTSEVKREWQLYQARLHGRSLIHQPRRTNFFWDVEQLKFAYRELWNPYRWPEPERFL